MDKLLQWFFARAKEPSSLVSLGAAAGLIGLHIDQSQLSAVLDIVAALGTLLGFITAESSK